MFLEFYSQKKILQFFIHLPFSRKWGQSDVTRKLIVFILVDMDRGHQDSYVGTKNNIIVP